MNRVTSDRQLSRRSALAAPAVLLAGQRLNAAQQKPNVVVFISDQQRQDTLGCYGNPLVRTPNLDRLAERGARFDNAFCTTPLCSPARASIFTGVYPHRHGIVDLWGKIPSALGPVPGWKTPSREQLPWMGELFSQAGYHTAYCGKWHCLTGARRPGFAETLSRYGDPDDVEEPGQDDFAAAAARKGYRFSGHAHSAYSSKGPRYGVSIFALEDHPDTYLVEKACEFLRRKHDRPFLLVVSVNSPHSPYAPPKPYDTMYDPRSIRLPENTRVFANPRRPIPLRGHPGGWKSAQQSSREELQGAWACYLGMVSHIDNLIGRMMAAIETTGRAGNTVFLYTTDHGDTMGSHRLQDKGPFMYDTVARIPLLISWPGRVRSTWVSTPVSQADVLPTLLDFAGIRDPARRDGRSLAPALAGDATLEDRPIFCEYNRFYGEHFPVRAIVTRRHKYVHYFGPEGELFDRQEDPEEIHNLLFDPGYRQTLSSLQKQLFAHLLRSGDPYAALLTGEERRLAATATR